MKGMHRQRLGILYCEQTNVPGKMHRTPWATGDSHSLGSHVTHHQGGPPRARHQNQNQNSFGAYKSRGEAVAARAQMRANNVDIQLEQMRVARYALLPSCARAKAQCSTSPHTPTALQRSRWREGGSLRAG